MKWFEITLREALEHANGLYMDNANMSAARRKLIPEPPTEEAVTDFITFKNGTALAFTLGRTIDVSTEVTPMTETVASEVWLYD